MKIVHYYARYRSHTSGVTDSINNWAAQAQRLGHTVRVFSAPTATSGDDDYINVDISQTIPHIGRSRTTWIPIGLLSKVKRGDLLYVHEGWTLSNVAAAMIGRLKGAVVIAMPHGVYEPGITSAMHDLCGMRARLERLSLAMADLVHVFYPGEVDVVQRFAPRARQFITIPNGGPAPTDELTWRGQGDYFVWMGRFDIEHKGLDNLLQFWSHLPMPRPRLVLAGPNYSGGREAVQRIAAALDLECEVQIRGRVSGRQKADLILNARGYVHPSRWESCSITLLECLSAGTPCLVSRTVHAATALAPEGVILSTDFASDNYLEAERVLADLDRNVDLSWRARQWAQEKGSWQAVGEKYGQVLNGAIRGYHS